MRGKINKFVKTIKLYEDGNLEALKTGALQIQPGQWVQCMPESKPSRWVGVNGLTVWAVHYPVKMEQFQAMRKTLKKSQEKARAQKAAEAAVYKELVIMGDKPKPARKKIEPAFTDRERGKPTLRYLLAMVLLICIS